MQWCGSRISGGPSCPGWTTRRILISISIRRSPSPYSRRLAQTRSPRRKDIRKTMEIASKRFPQGLKYDIVYDPTQFIQQSVDAVMETILEAILLVILVVVLFLQTWRAAIIPLVAIPVSLIGTFFLMAAFGFSLNNLSLFGLVLAVGIVVDDAIVVVENVERNLANGLSPRDAARRSMDEVGGALVAIAARAVRGVRPVRVHHWNLRPVLQAVRTDHRRRHGDFAHRLADAIAGALCAAAASASRARDSWLVAAAAARLLRLFQWGVRQARPGLRLARLAGGPLRRHHARAYAGIIAFGLNEFRKTPIGFIPALDRGYLIGGGPTAARRRAIAHRRGAATHCRHCAEGSRRHRRDEHRRLLPAQPSPTRRMRAPPSWCWIRSKSGPGIPTSPSSVSSVPCSAS